MKVNQQHYRAIWANRQYQYVEIINQTCLPFRFEIVRIQDMEQMITAICTMQVRGAPLIGVSAAYGIALAMRQATDDTHLVHAMQQLKQSRPTAVNLTWALDRMYQVLIPLNPAKRYQAAWQEAAKMADEDVQQNQAIGQQGFSLIQPFAQQKVINILTHCNAGWLATVDYGTALSPIYAAHDAGLPVHVWVDETRPRNQGASLTAWELAQHGVPHTVITDNAGGHLMQHGQVDMVIVGADRVSGCGDVCNKIGTYLKALSAYDNQIPFYAAVPTPTIDWQINDALTEIEIEQRHADEVAYMHGLATDGSVQNVRMVPENSAVQNPAFDVTPARLVTAIITEQGIYSPSQLGKMKP